MVEKWTYNVRWINISIIVNKKMLLEYHWLECWMFTKFESILQYQGLKRLAKKQERNLESNLLQNPNQLTEKKNTMDIMYAPTLEIKLGHCLWIMPRKSLYFGRFLFFHLKKFRFTICSIIQEQKYVANNGNKFIFNSKFLFH